MLRMKKRSLAAYLIVAAGILLIILSGFYCGDKVCGCKESVAIQQIEPSAVKNGEDGTYAFLELDGGGHGASSLEFKTDHQTVQVYTGDQLIYEVREGDTVFGKTTGERFHFVDLPLGEQEITVVLREIYPEIKHGIPEFHLGDKQLMYQEYLLRSLIGFLVEFLMIAFGIALFFYWILVKKELKRDKEVFYFSAFLVLTGAWLLRGSDLTLLLFHNYTALSYSGYILMMLIPVAFFKFNQYFWEMKENVCQRAFCIASSLNGILCTVLHMTGIREFKQTVAGTHLLILLALIHMFVGIWSYYKRNGADYKTKGGLSCIAILLAAVFYDYIGFYQNVVRIYEVGRIGIWGVLILIGCIMMQELSGQLKEGRKNAIYKELAEIDQLTGFYNRNAYNRWEEANQQNFSQIGMAICDLNDLKKHNDTMGHEYGDQYIIAAAGIIRSSIGEHGNCYRIGGDEFCITWQEKPAEEYLAERWNMMKKLQEQYNSASQDVRIYIACGYAQASEEDQCIKDIRSRADIRMYQNKKNMKGLDCPR